MTSELQRDIELVDEYLKGWTPFTGVAEAWQRIRQRLTPDVRNPDCGFMFCDSGAGSMPSPALRLTPDRERVARALFAAIVSEGGMRPHQFETIDGEVKKRLRALADAAINAMGEP